MLQRWLSLPHFLPNSFSSSLPFSLICTPSSSIVGMTQACMQAQTDHELMLHPTPLDYAPVITTQPMPSNVSDRTPLMSAEQQAPPPPVYEK
eukprot:m.36037 g.36037  ORF g.36037 m.36037 type:complete len:92 (-) comp9951_c0_seq1:1599-1874(-)